MPLIIGFFLNGRMWIGITYLIRNEKKMSNLVHGESSLSRRFKLLQILAVLSLVALWHDLSTLVYLSLMTRGLHTFQLDIETFAEQADTIAFIISTAGTSAIGSIMLIGFKSTLKFRGRATVVAALLIEHQLPSI